MINIVIQMERAALDNEVMKRRPSGMHGSTVVLK
jgi:hypothetical protein